MRLKIHPNILNSSIAKTGLDAALVRKFGFGPDQALLNYQIYFAHFRTYFLSYLADIYASIKLLLIQTFYARYLILSGVINEIKDSPFMSVEINISCNFLSLCFD